MLVIEIGLAVPEAPIPKHQTPENTQAPITKQPLSCSLELEIGISLVLGIGIRCLKSRRQRLLWIFHQHDLAGFTTHAERISATFLGSELGLVCRLSNEIRVWRHGYDMFAR